MATRLFKPSTSISLLVTTFLLLSFQISATAADLQFKSETLLRGFERDTASSNDELVAPTYEYLQLDISDLQLEGLSFHGYGWGRYDTADSGYFSDQEAGELLYAYLQYRSPDRPFSLQLGRQHIFAGVANDTIDGLLISTTVAPGLSINAFGGQPVAFSTENSRSGDSIYGGRVAYSYQSTYELGVSYLSSENDSEQADNLVGIDMSFALPQNMDFYGSSTRNLETEGWAQHSYELNINLSGLRLRPYYEFYAYEDYFDTGTSSTNPFSLLTRSGEEISVLGMDASWRYSEAFTFAGKLKTYSYDQNQSSNYISFLVTWNDQATELSQLGAEIGYMNGDAANNDYLLLRLYGYRDELGASYWIDFVSADITYALYDRDIYGRGYSFFSSVGAGKQFLNDRLTVKLSGDYRQDPYFDDDLQAMLALSYAFDFSM